MVTYRKLRARNAGPTTGDDQIFELMTADDPEVDTMKASYREEFRTAFRAAIAALPRRERTSLRFNVLDGLSIDAIGKTYGAHRATAAHLLTMRASAAPIAKVPTATRDHDAANKLFIGRVNNGEYYFDGRLDDFQLYARALAWPEIMTIYDCTFVAP